MPKPLLALSDLQHASEAELIAAHNAGMSLIAWRAAGKPREREQNTVGKRHGGRQKPDSNHSAKSLAAFTRPWAPYRSKWEQAYAHHLALRKQCGFLVDVAYEPDRLLIGVRAYYTPDFRLTFDDGRIQYHEVKGYRREASIVRIKAAALRYPQWKFVIVTRVDGEWVHQTIGAQP